MASSRWSDDIGSKDHSKSSLQCCEVCGVKGLSDEGLRRHLQQEHVQDCSVCPFCDMVDISAEVMMVHVNEAHLDYLSPQMEIIDDSELYEDCMDSTSGSGTGTALDACINKAANGSSSRQPTQAKAQSKFPSLPPPPHQPPVSGGGAVSKRPPLSDRSNSQGRKGHHDRAADIDQRLTRSASNSPAYTRRPVQNLNEVEGKGAPLISIDDNCNLHVSGGRDSASSSPSRSHLALALNTQAGGKKRNRSDSRRDAFASHRSNSTPVTGTVGVEARQRVPPSATQEDTTDVMDVVTQCPICGRRESNPQQMERHINQAHFDSTSPDAEGATAGTSAALQCPLCSQVFESGQDVELHVNIQHRDILSPDTGSSGVAKSQQTRAALPAVGSGESLCARGGGSASNLGSDSSSSTTGSSGGESGCPVCGRTGFTDNPSLALHIETHFNGRSAAVSPEQSGSLDNSQQAAQERRDQDLRRMREKQEFSQLQAQYGMDGCGSFKQQYVSSMQRAVYSGKMSITDYYERQIQLKHAEKTGLDDTRTRTKGLLTGIQALSLRCRDVRQLLLCSAVDHFGSTYGDKGWGCGYRNIQMLLSSLQHHTGYYERLFPAPDAIPSIAALQGLVEKAWAAGFDSQGCEQLGGKLINTRKWIGATELCTLLSYFRIKCQLLDFHRPTDTDGSHPELFEWCRKYFASTHDFKPPLYLQHQGHSRTIIGCEVMAGAQEGAVQLLVLDPSHSATQVLRIAQARTDSPDQQQEQQPPQRCGRGGGKSVGYTLSGAKVVVNNDDWRSGGRGGRGRAGGGGSKGNNSNLGGGGSLRMLRRPLRTMKAQQYQVVAVVGIMETEQEYLKSKVLRSTRIPKT